MWILNAMGQVLMHNMNTTQIDGRCNAVLPTWHNDKIPKPLIHHNELDGTCPSWENALYHTTFTSTVPSHSSIKSFRDHMVNPLHAIGAMRPLCWHATKIRLFQCWNKMHSTPAIEVDLSIALVLGGCLCNVFHSAINFFCYFVVCAL